MNFSRLSRRLARSEILAMRTPQLDATDVRAAADALKQSLEVLMARTESDTEAAFETMIRRQVGALIVMPDHIFHRSTRTAGLAGILGCGIVKLPCASASVTIEHVTLATSLARRSTEGSLRGGWGNLVAHDGMLKRPADLYTTTVRGQSRDEWRTDRFFPCPTISSSAVKPKTTTDQIDDIPP
jgi:hypothetical protein